MKKDIRTAVDDMHVTSLALKTTILSDPGKYIRKDERLESSLTRLKSMGKKLFIVTNSDWWYTNNIMQFLLGHSWRSFFHLVIVDAWKPKFFSSTKELVRLDLGEDDQGIPVYSGGDQVVY